MPKKLTTKIFIQRAVSTHGNRYDYSKVKYKNSRTDVTIICREHGEFKQSAYSHTQQGIGCAYCAGKARNTKTFIVDAKKTHGDRYDYSISMYINSKTKISIICKKHGEFRQTPKTHISGSSCKKCVNEERAISSAVFFERAIEAHGNRYDLTETKYEGLTKRIVAVCRVHGSFNKVASNFINGSGCLECAKEEGRYKNTKTTEEFIADAIGIHGSRYRYSLADYVNNKTKVIITCKKHGDFTQRPSDHLNGQGCPKCSPHKKTSIYDFLEKAKEVHGNRYDYSLVDYKGVSTNVVIVCRKHGKFKQQPRSHIAGYGCGICSNSRKITPAVFLERAFFVHGEKYEYDINNYKTAKTHIRITCKIHGYFEQTPAAHLRGHGCPSCANYAIAKKLTKTTDQFIEDAIAVHGNAYDYSRVVYKLSSRKVIIICDKHGAFSQAPGDHLKGSGCRTCKTSLGIDKFIKRAKETHGDRYIYKRTIYTSGSKNVNIDCAIHGNFSVVASSHIRGAGCPRCSDASFLNTELFIERAKKAHGEKYDYSLSEYTSWKNKVTIICKKHGKFRKKPHPHMNGSGCKMCGNEIKNTEFVSRSNGVHGGKYSYRLTKYKRSKGKVTIICKKHGEFRQVAASHLKGSGCPTCSGSYGEKSVANILDKHGISYVREKRFADCRGKYPLPFDFYIPYGKIAIEYQGQQHFSPVSYFGGKATFARQKKYDQIKRDYCAANKIYLIEIPYTAADIEDFLLTALPSHSIPSLLNVQGSFSFLELMPA